MGATMEMYDLRSARTRKFSFDDEEDRKAICAEYGRLHQNVLSSSSELSMLHMEELADLSGFKFQMVNEPAHNQQHAFVRSRFELVELNKTNDIADDFSDAVANIPVDNKQMEL